MSTPTPAVVDEEERPSAKPPAPTTATLAGATELSASPVFKATAAGLYAVLSFAIVFVNKFVLTVYEFPSFLFLALLQYTTTTIIMAVQKWLHARRQQRSGEHGPPLFPNVSFAAIRFVMPLPIIYLFNTVAGLGATQKLNMPMFVLLRRFSILMTMALEAYTLRKVFPRQVHGAVGLMVLGAVVAALNDLQMDTAGYSMIMVNNVMTAAQGVFTRAVLDATHGDRALMNSDGVLFFNAAVAAPLVLCIFFTAPGQLEAVLAYPRWHDPLFLLCLVSSMLLGFLLNYSYFLCNKVNSPLTTTIVGSVKNVVTSYLGMLIRDYHFTLANFLGVNIGALGTALYAHAEIHKVLGLQRQKDRDTAVAAVEEAAPEPAPEPKPRAGWV